MVDIKDIKKVDNQLTYVIGYRNLYNIMVTAVGFIMAVVLPGTQESFLAGLIIFLIGTSNWLFQIRDNMDAISVEELARKEK